MLFKLAWRNIWRKKWRTVITMGIVFIAVILSTLMSAFKEGSYEGMIESMVGSFTGYAQIHSKGYWEEKSIDNLLRVDDALKSTLEAEPKLKGFVQRLESFALAATDDQTRGAMVVGIQPELEDHYSQLSERVVEGEFLAANDQGILVGKGLAKHLKVALGDTLVLFGQGYHGSTAAGKYPIRGIIKYGNPELSKQLVFLPLALAQQLYGTEGQVSNIILQFHEPEDAFEVVKALKENLSGQYEVMDWLELVPDLINMIETDRVEGWVFMFILYVVISFGMFGTMLMMLAERRQEPGVLVAIGMKRGKLAIMVWVEMMSISLLGALVGMLGAFPVVFYFHIFPIEFGEELAKMMEEYGMEAVLRTSIDSGIFIRQTIIVSIIASIIAIYPLIKLTRLNAIKAMRK